MCLYLVFCPEFYSDNNSSVQIDVFYVIPESTTTVERNESKDDKFPFSITNGERTLEVAVNDEQTRSDWMMMIHRVSYQEFGKRYDDIDTAYNTPDQSPNRMKNDEADNSDNESEISIREINDIATSLKFDREDDIRSESSNDAAIVNENVDQSPEKSLFLLFPSVENCNSNFNEEHVIDKSNNEGNTNIESEVNATMSYLDIRGELKGLFYEHNLGRSYNKNRLFALLSCLQSNNVYVEKENKARIKWLAEVSSFALECFEIQKGFVPRNIFHSSLSSLRTESKLNKHVARRLTKKKCLWLIRMNPVDISRLSIEDLEGMRYILSCIFHFLLQTNFPISGRFNPSNQSLDIVEVFAIFYALPDKFSNDIGGRKTFWKQCIEEHAKHLFVKKSNNSLLTYEKRHKVYEGITPPFTSDNSTYIFEE